MSGTLLGLGKWWGGCEENFLGRPFCVSELSHLPSVGFQDSLQSGCLLEIRDFPKQRIHSDYQNMRPKVPISQW